MKKSSFNQKNIPNKGSSNFLITIYHQENHSWQGVIQWLDTGKKVHFRSELELLNLINSALHVTTKPMEELRNWTEDEAFKTAL